jgi:flagellar hook-associated protein 1 FlgK
MAWTFLGIHTALSGILAQQRAMDATAHNIANAQTPGFRRQEAVLATNQPYPPPGQLAAIGMGQYGTGVQVAMVRRAQDQFLDLHARLLDSQLGAWTAASSVMQEVEGIIASESGTDLDALLDRFWDAWQEVSIHPEDSAIRVTLRQETLTLTAAFRDTVTRLRDSQAGIDRVIEGRVQEINNMAAEVAQCNREITAVLAEGNQPNDLLDRRDYLLGQLSEMVGATTLITTDGNIIVNIGGRPLVEGVESFALQSPLGAGGHVDVQWADGTAVNITNGELAGLLEMRDTAIPDYLAQLDAIAAGLIARVNELHEAGYGLDNSTGVSFLTGASAADIALDGAIVADVRAIAAATALDAPGDGGNALAIAQVRDEILVASQTLNQAFRSLLSQVGSKARDAQERAESLDFARQQVAEQQQSLYGVSLDEEMTNMLQFQHAYNAAARVLTALDEMLVTLIERMGAG